MKLKKVTDTKSCLKHFYTFVFCNFHTHIVTYFMAEGLIVSSILAMDNIDVIKVLQEEAKQTYGDAAVFINVDIDYEFKIFMAGVIMYGILIFMHIINGLAVMCGGLDHKYIPINIFSYGSFVCWIISGVYLRKYLAEPNIGDKKICYNATVAGILI